MGKVTPEELSKLEHINAKVLGGRTLNLVPVWDGANWSAWFPGPDGRLISLKIVDAAHSLYLTKVGAARPSDLSIHMIEFVWQRLSYPELVGFIRAIEDDFHLLATSAAKLEHFHASRDTIDAGLIESFVRSELEYILIVGRSVFDLLQEVISGFWNETVKLLDGTDEARKRQNTLPAGFARVAFGGQDLRTAEEIVEKYALPPPVAEQYAKHGPFFASLRRYRDYIIHGLSSPGHIFTTEKGFAVMPRAKMYEDFPWTIEHHYNDNIVSLMPWIAHIVAHTIEACTEILRALAGSIQCPEEIAPGYRLLLRDPANPALLRLMEAAQGKRIWWSDDSTEAPVPTAARGATEKSP